MLIASEIEVEVWIIFWYTTNGASKIESEKNKKEWLKPNIPMTVKQACQEYGITPLTYYSHLNKFPQIKKKYELMKSNRREYMKALAEDNILSVLEGDELEWKEKFDANFKFLQATEKAYNPKTEIETKNLNINISKTSEDIMKDIRDLTWS